MDETISELKQGMFAEFRSSYFKKDSTISLDFDIGMLILILEVLVLKRRINMNETNVGSIYSLFE